MAVLRSTGDVALNVAAAQALIHWRFQPGLYQRVTIPVNFRILKRANRRATILD